MKKIITIAILFFGSLSFAQARALETVSFEKTCLVDNGSHAQKNVDEFIKLENESLKKIDLITDKDFTNFNKKRIHGFTENVLFDLKLVLPSNLVWLYSSIV